MFNENAKSTDLTVASVSAGAGSQERVGGGGVFHFKCYDKDGNLKWEDKAYNMVVQQGLQDMNSKYFTGSSYSATWYLGLVNNSPAPTYNTNDTLASHATWNETTSYTGNRKAVTFGTASTADPSIIDNAASPAQFSMNATLTVAGAFLASVATGTSGILFSVANFAAPGGARSVVSGDTLSVTYQFSLDAI